MTDGTGKDLGLKQQPTGKPASRFFARGWLMVLCAYIVAVITQGMGIYSFTMLRGSIAQSLGVTPPEVAATFSFYVMTLAVVGLFVGTVIEKLGLRISLIISAVLFSGGLLLQTVANDLTFLYFACAIMGAGSAFGGVLVITGIPSNWFVKHRGLANGIVWSSTFIGSLLTTNLIAAVISSADWHTAVYMLATISAAVLFIASFVLKWRPQDIGLLPDGMSKEESAAIAEQAGSAKVVGLTRFQAIKTPTFWILAAGILMIGFAEMGPTQSLPSYFTARGNDLATAAAFMSFFTFTGLIGKICAGFIIDRIGARWAFVLIEIFAAAGLLMLAFADASSSIVYMYVAIALFGLGENASIVCFSASTGKFLGVKYYAHIFGLIFLAKAMGDSVGAPLIPAMAAGDAGWTGAFIAAAIVALIAGAVFFFAKKSKLLTGLEEQAAIDIVKDRD
ncbi:MFS transporter [Actinomycetota bacterium]|nr:MFS transporter [Actinomycetota bacterium]